MVSHPLEMPKDRLQALGPLRMAHGHAMIEHATIRKESDDHGSSSAWN
jgi:hypothetical protein